MQHVVGTEDNVCARFGEADSMFDRTERVTKCRGQHQLAIGSRNREEHFKNLVEMTSSVFIARLRQKRLVDHAVVADANCEVNFDS